MKRFFLAALLVTLLAGCGGSPLSFLTGGGPNVAANVQAGAENNQTVGVSYSTKQTLTRPQARTIEQSAGDTSVRTEMVERIVVNELDWRYVLIIALLAGFLIPSPAEIARWLVGLFQRKRAGPA